MKSNTRRRFALLGLLVTPLLAVAQTEAPPAAPAAPAAATPASPGLSPLPATPPAPAAEAVAPVAAEKAKDTLSVDFPDEDIRNILRNVADLFELNIVMPDALQGRTSIKLRDVTWRQIFSFVLEPQGYTFVEDKNVVRIVNRASLLDEPFITETYALKNIPATNIESVLKPMLTQAVTEKDQRAAVPGGSLLVNALANELIITDRPAVVQKVIKTASRLDVEPRQVVIETKFVEITSDTEKKLGLDWAAAGGITAGVTQSAVAAGKNAVNYTSATTAAAAKGFSYSTAMLSNAELTSTLNFLNTAGDTKILSNPTIVAVNGSKSTIKIGRDLQTVTATQQVTASGQPGQVTYSEGKIIFEGVSIEITPQITGSRLVALSITTEKSEAQPFDVKGTVDQTFYNLNLRKGSLNMILPDGQTAAISGLNDRVEVKGETKLPFFGDLPGVGRLFRNKTNKVNDRNLLIFITANILEPSNTTYRNFSTADQRDRLGLTQREIQGVNYKASAEEQAAFDAAEARRESAQSGEILGRAKKSESPKGH